MSWAILCESSDLGAQCRRAAAGVELEATVHEQTGLRSAALQALGANAPVALVYLNPPTLADLVELATTAHARDAQLALALLAPTSQRRVLLDVAGELGMCAVGELRPLVAALALLGCGGTRAFESSARALCAADRTRLQAALVGDAQRDGELIAIDTGCIAYRRHETSAAVRLGEACDVAQALTALRRIERGSPRVVSSVDGVDARAILEVIFGPRRALSDPTSKAALAPYGIPTPVEELCGSASRAASEASRIGYPVRIALASPDLRVWDHPELSIDMVDNAARVRDTFRQLVALAQSRLATDAQAEQRVLGVMVTTTSEAAVLLRVRASALPGDRVAIEIGFADPHGRAARDETMTILPADPRVIERALRRLAGADLLFDVPPALRQTRVDAVADVLLRVCAFVNDFRAQIEAVELRPLALLLDGTAEVREACVLVSDYFERQAEGDAHKML